MRGFQRGSQLLAAALQISRVPRAQVRSGPPENPLSAGVSIRGGAGKPGTSQLEGPKPSVSGPNYFGRGWKQKGRGGKKECALRLQPTPPLCPCPAPHLWLLLLCAFVLSAPFLTFGIWGSPAGTGPDPVPLSWDSHPKGVSPKARTGAAVTAEPKILLILPL